MSARSLLAALLGALVTAAPAQAAVPLSRVRDNAGMALVGDTALYTRGGGQARVLARPADGSAPATTRLRLAEGSVRLSGSPQLAGAVAYTPAGSQVYSGPAAGPFAPFGARVAPDADDFPAETLVDGDRLLVTEIDASFSHFRYRISEGNSLLADFSVDGLVEGFAGDLVAYSDGNRLVVRNWRDGSERVVVPRHVDAFDVRADGSTVIELRDGGVEAVSPAGAVTPISKTGGMPKFAGDRVVYWDRDGLMIAVPGSGPRPFGPRTATFRDFDADERHVLWNAHGCLLSAPLDEPAANAPGPGPCARSELAVVPRRATVRADRHVPVSLRWLAAPHTCRGTVRVGAGARVRFSIPVGATRRVTPRLTGADYRAALAGRGHLAVLKVHAVTVDPDGRRVVLSRAIDVTAR
jgi:hypothetical protein